VKIHHYLHQEQFGNHSSAPRLLSTRSASSSETIACVFKQGDIFPLDLNIFELQNPALPFFAFSFSQLLGGGLGPGNGSAELVSIYALDCDGQQSSPVYDGGKLYPTPVMEIALHAAPPTAVSRIKVAFLTPTELKSGGAVVRDPEFGVVFARARDRIHTLRQLYGAGALEIDFAAMGERARHVKLLRQEIAWEKYERSSGRTGQTHPLAGFTGWAEYEGDLSEFLPYLRAASWTGVGRQTTWGKGQIKVTSLA
jgi:CRISPR-associated endoribonuclease Cas6